MIELRLYRYFVTLAETLHFGRAAARLGIAQPPFSQQIQKLEHDLGTLLLRRNNRKVELTPAGMAFLEEARRTLAAAERAERAARLAGEGRSGQLSIGMINSAVYEDTIPTVVLRLSERHPGIDLSLREMTTPQQIRALHAGEIQVGFVRPPIHDTELETLTVHTEPLLLALPAAHPLAGLPAVPLGKLAADPWVMLPSGLGLGFYEQVIDICRKAGFMPETHQVATEIPTMISLIAAGLGVTLVPASITNLRRTGVVYRPIEGQNELVETVAVWTPAHASPLLDRFLEILREVVTGAPAI